MPLVSKAPAALWLWGDTNEKGHRITCSASFTECLPVAVPGFSSGVWWWSQSLVEGPLQWADFLPHLLQALALPSVGKCVSFPESAADQVYLARKALSF